VLISINEKLQFLINENAKYWKQTFRLIIRISVNNNMSRHNYFIFGPEKLSFLNEKLQFLINGNEQFLIKEDACSC